MVFPMVPSKIRVMILGLTYGLVMLLTTSLGAGLVKSILENFNLNHNMHIDGWDRSSPIENKSTDLSILRAQHLLMNCQRRSYFGFLAPDIRVP